MRNAVLKFVCLLSVCSGFMLLVATPDAAAEVTTADRMTSVEKLIGTSSAARKVEGSGNREAIEQQGRARALFERARQSHADGKQAEADSLLQQATRTMFEAVRMVDKPQSLIDKDSRDFDARLESVNALCDAYDRISQEKGLGPAEKSDLYPIVHRKLDEADALRKAGKVPEGRKALDEAYVAAKVGIEHLRGGDTLVRSLNFATPEEEYDYEVDRNDTHRMLVRVLLKEKIAQSESIHSMVDKFMGKADDLRNKAEQQAGKGDFDTAIHTLEESTREIVRAIRSAGIYIPG
jgi:cellobiose-specific phosphotransferase system component IIA